MRPEQLHCTNILKVITRRRGALIYVTNSKPTRPRRASLRIAFAIHFMEVVSVIRKNLQNANLSCNRRSSVGFGIRQLCLGAATAV